MITTDHMKVDHMQSWMDDDGTLNLYNHEVGVASRAISGLNAEEGQGSLDVLSRHYEAIDQAVTHEESDWEEDYTGGWLYVGR